MNIQNFSRDGREESAQSFLLEMWRERESKGLLREGHSMVMIHNFLDMFFFQRFLLF